MLCDKFALVRVPRTGSGTSRMWIMKLFPQSIVKDIDSRSIRHIYTDSLPPTFACMRNPWDWYVSRYEWCRLRRFENHGGPAGLWLKGLDAGIIDCKDESSCMSFADHMHEGFTKDDANPIRVWNDGALDPPPFTFSEMLKAMICIDEKIVVTHLGKKESLANDFSRFLSDVGMGSVSLPDLSIHSTEEYRSHTHSYYTDDLAAEVRLRDAWVIALGDYVF